MKEEPISGLFIPGREVKIFAASPKRSQGFVAIYWDFYASEASPSAKETLIGLALLSSYQNEVIGKAEDLARKLKIGVRKLRLDLKNLRNSDLVRGQPPLLRLNPFAVSRCGAVLLADLRNSWVRRVD